MQTDRQDVCNYFEEEAQDKSQYNIQVETLGGSENNSKHGEEEEGSDSLPVSVERANRDHSL